MDALRVNPAVPVTPRQIADECLRARPLAPRSSHPCPHPENGTPSMEVAHYEEVVT
jgi:uncharacterized protein (DUF849 family)